MRLPRGLHLPVAQPLLLPLHLLLPPLHLLLQGSPKTCSRQVLFVTVYDVLLNNLFSWHSSNSSKEEDMAVLEQVSPQASTLKQSEIAPKSSNFGKHCSKILRPPRLCFSSSLPRILLSPR